MKQKMSWDIPAFQFVCGLLVRRGPAWRYVKYCEALASPQQYYVYLLHWK